MSLLKDTLINFVRKVKLSAHKVKKTVFLYLETNKGQLYVSIQKKTTISHIQQRRVQLIYDIAMPHPKTHQQLEDGDVIQTNCALSNNCRMLLNAKSVFHLNNIFNCTTQQLNLIQVFLVLHNT